MSERGRLIQDISATHAVGGIVFAGALHIQVFAFGISKGVMTMVRVSVVGADAEELPVPAEYHLAYVGLSPAAVDARANSGARGGG